ncbi:MAG: S8 family peptidase [Bacteroidota bacterium]
MKKPNPFKLLVVAACFCLPLLASAQAKKPLPNWQNLDLKTDGMFGIGTEKAYTELLKDKKHTTVLVAVIDGGVDINHEDLKKIIWVNPKEIEGNKADDDGNGYADDLHGWNFIGSVEKGDVHYDNLELTRILRRDMSKYKYANTKTLSPDELVKYHEYQKMDEVLNTKLKEAQESSSGMLNFTLRLNELVKNIGKANPTMKDFEGYNPQNEVETRLRKVIMENWTTGDFNTFMEDEIYGGLKHYREVMDYHLNLDFDSRDTVGDNYANINEHFYGNNDVAGPDADHGSHVSGIIGAVRDNNLGIKGVANDVVIMSVRTVPNGDERDKDVANAIRYAAANGARVINMSFGKDYSWNKAAVDEAVKFAMSKDVLLVHAAGNDSKDNDVKVSYPNRVYEDKSGTAAGWIEIGASGFKDDDNLAASFSNYGKTTVDVFAPGVKILSTTPGSTYKEHDGTSMAAPVVTGLAALIRSYYPALTAVQVKEIIMKSVTKVDHKVVIKTEKSTKKVPFAEICQSGGIVNAYEALKLAATY